MEMSGVMEVFDRNNRLIKTIRDDTGRTPACGFAGCKNELNGSEIRFLVKGKYVPTGAWKCMEACFLVCGVNGDWDDFFREQERLSQGLQVNL